MSDTTPVKNDPAEASAFLQEHVQKIKVDSENGPNQLFNALQLLAVVSALRPGCSLDTLRERFGYRSSRNVWVVPRSATDRGQE